MYKIKVVPEGRDGIWIINVDTAKDVIDHYNSDVIHCIRPAGFAILGADWQKTNVVEHLKHSTKIALTTGEAFNQNFKHALAVITDELYLFDVGTISEDDLVKEKSDN